MSEKFTTKWLQEYEQKHKAGNRLQDTVPQCAVRDEPLGQDAGKETRPSVIVVRIESRRTRLLDLDNLYGGSKFLIDAARYRNLISGDSSKEIDLRISQVKVAKGEEKTILEIIYP